MSHEMTENDQMYSVRIAPWHIGMGTNVLILDTNPETRNERMVAAGHNWLVNESKVYRQLGYRLGKTQVEGWNILTRSDTNDVLNITGDSYEVVQNVVCHELFEAFIEGAKLDDGTGGTTRNGKVCYLSARIDEPRQVNGDDSEIYPYIGVLWSHDKSTGIQGFKTTVRMVCYNTIRLAELSSKAAGRNYTFSGKHTGNILDRIEEAKQVISGARDDTLRYIEIANELGLIPITPMQHVDFVNQLIPMPPIKFVTDRVMDNVLDARIKVESLFDGPTIPEAHKDTGYGLLQAGIEYLDHLRGYQSSDTYLGRTLLREEPLKRRLVPIIRQFGAEQ